MASCARPARGANVLAFRCSVPRNSPIPGATDAPAGRGSLPCTPQPVPRKESVMSAPLLTETPAPTCHVRCDHVEPTNGTTFSSSDPDPLGEGDLLLIGRDPSLEQIPLHAKRAFVESLLADGRQLRTERTSA